MSGPKHGLPCIMETTFSRPRKLLWARETCLEVVVWVSLVIVSITVTNLKKLLGQSGIQWVSIILLSAMVGRLEEVPSQEGSIHPCGRN